MAMQDGPEGGVNEDAIYDQFPRGADQGYGPEEGFNRWVHLNNPMWFTDEARANPVIREFLNAPFAVSYAQFKSSHSETEYWIHKPRRAMTGGVEGIVGVAEGLPEDGRIGTFVVNHEETLAIHITRTLLIADGSTAGQMIHKEPG